MLPGFQYSNSELQVKELQETESISKGVLRETQRQQERKRKIKTLEETEASGTCTYNEH